MRPLIILAVIALPAGFSSPAFAEQKPPNAMHYTRISETPPEKDDQHIKLKTIKHDEEAKKEEESGSTRIWNKYKALAAGQPELTEEEKAAREEEEKAEAEAELAAKIKEEEEAKAKEKAEQEPPPPTGIAAIIDEYKKNKAQRSQMRTINVTNPDEFKTQKEGAKEKPES